MGPEQDWQVSAAWPGLLRKRGGRLSGPILSLREVSTAPSSIQGGIGLQGHQSTHPVSWGASDRKKGESTPVPEPPNRRVCARVECFLMTTHFFYFDSVYLDVGTWASSFTPGLLVVDESLHNKMRHFLYCWRVWNLQADNKDFLTTHNTQKMLLNRHQSEHWQILNK